MNSLANKVKVLIVDDSAFIRVLLTEILESDNSIEVVATAVDPIDARQKIKKYSPDVITLDVEMPKMDGITFLKNLMRLRPMPVVMVSTLTQAGADVTMEALRIGAFDFVSKPTVDVKSQLSDSAEELIEKVLAAAICNVSALERPQSKPVTASQQLSSGTSKYEIIAIGASTGGTEAIRDIVTHLPNNMPPIVMSQHIPPAFSSSYARRLNKESSCRVVEVVSSTKLESGCAYLAPGSHHLIVEYKAGEYWASLNDGERVNRHKPSVDVLFDSILKIHPEKCLAIILTGMGKDGAEGLNRLKEAGAETIAQDQDSSVVWGMPGAAVALGAATHVLPLSGIAEHIVSNQ